MGATGVAVKMAGARRYLGREIDRERAKVAQGHLGTTAEGGSRE
jgi:hypothetical protein